MQKDINNIFGYQQITSLSSAAGLTVPATNLQGLVGTPTFAVIRCETQAVRWRDDGVAPTATVGMPLAVGDVLKYDGDLKRIKFFEQTASAKLNVSYYS
jgi:hypothetical protein